jgi:phage tail-like protein
MQYLLEIRNPDGSRHEILLAETTTIGRQQGNDLVFDDERVSRRHAIIECHDDLCWLTDLGSSNGTALGDERLPPNAATPVPPGMEIRIGSWRLSLTLRQSIEPVPTHLASTDSPVPSRAGEIAAETPDEELVPPEEESAAGQPVAMKLPEEQSPPPEKERAAEPHEAMKPPEERRPPPAGESRGGGTPPAHDDFFPPGLGYHSRSLLAYLPGIYQTEFVSRFLALFESILTPMEWNIDNFDLFLDPGTAPSDFLTWLEEWFDITFDPTWNDTQRRRLLREAHTIYARRGTRWALSRVLEIYTGSSPTIVDVDATLEPFTFRVTLPMAAARLGREVIEHLIDAHKPTHTMYTLDFS